MAAWWVSVAPPALAQSAPWNWGWPSATSPGQDFKPDVFADFLGSGQPPHPAVVRIIAPENGGTSMGSGVLVDINSTQGLVLTNWHVIRGASSAVLVQFPDGFQTAGTVIRHDEPWDLAAVAIWRPRAVPIPIAPTPPAIGDPLTIAGYGKGPFRSEAGPCTQYLAPGSGYPLEFVELRATARRGDSGGPILNARGELAGILFGQAQGHTIGACSTRVRTFLAGIGSKGLTPEMAAALGASAADRRDLLGPGAMTPADAGTGQGGGIAVASPVDSIPNPSVSAIPPPSRIPVAIGRLHDELADVEQRVKMLMSAAKSPSPEEDDDENPGVERLPGATREGGEAASRKGAAKRTTERPSRGAAGRPKRLPGMDDPSPEV
jgi:S1-C subfamily serine protease